MNVAPASSVRAWFDAARRALGSLYPASEAASLAFMLAEHHFHAARPQVLADRMPADSVTAQAAFTRDLARLQTGEPWQYVRGETDFCGLSLRVDARALIPRPETETLVAWVAAACPRPAGLRVLDVGTGSGAIALGLAHRLAGARLTGIDVSAPALALARENGSRLGSNVTWRQADVLTPCRWLAEEKWDVVVSNPPYVLAGEAGQMHANVRDFEPALALFVPDDDPLLFYRALARLARNSLRAGGMMFLEIHQRFGAEVVALLESHGLTDVQLRADDFDRPRMVRARQPQEG